MESYASPTAPTVTSLTGKSRPAPGNSSAYRVLVVDDQQTVRAAIAALLNARGFEAVSVDTGFVALGMLKDEYFDVMICDVRMPEMSGLDLLSHALDIDRDLPVLMLTAVNDVATAREALERGAMDYLTKPIEMDDLDQIVRGAAEHRRHELSRRSGPHPAVPEGTPESRQLNLLGGPLDGRRVRLEDVRFRLWVLHQPDGEHVWASIEEPTNLPSGTRTIGSYVCTPPQEHMQWVPRG